MKTICPKCLNDETIRVNLDDGETLTCTGCDEEFTADDLRELVASWLPLLAWLDSHPARAETPKPATAAA